MDIKFDKKIEDFLKDTYQIGLDREPTFSEEMQKKIEQELKNMQQAYEEYLKKQEKEKSK